MEIWLMGWLNWRVSTKEAGETAQRKAAEAVDSQRTAEDGAEHVGQVAQLAVDGHCYQRIGVCLVGAVEQLIVEPVELLNGDFLMAKTLMTFWPFIISSM